MKNKTCITLVGILMTLVFGCILFPNTTKAAEIKTIVQTYTGSVNGVEREIILAESIFGADQVDLYLKIGNIEEPIGLPYGYLEAGPDQYGSVYFVDKNNTTIYWFNYDLTPDAHRVYTIPNPDPTEFVSWVHDVESLIFEGSGSQAIVVGYKTLSGEVYSLPSFDELKAIAAPGSSVPEPHYIPKGMEPDMPTPTPSTPTSVTPVPVADTPVPASDTPTPKVNANKVSIKTEKKAKVLYEGDYFIGQYTLKKGVLTWKGPKKKGNVKSVKYVGFIKKSKNLVYITKQGKAYTVSFKTGKKKLIVRKKKKAKKFIYSGKFVTKIKTTSGKISVVNK